MRKLILLAGFFLAFALLANTDWSSFSKETRPLVNSVTAPFGVARMYASEPDRTLPVPVEGVRVRQIVNTWHAARSEGRRHEGQDMFAPRGTPVRSATQGYVMRIGENRLGGNTVWVMGAGGRWYYYAHLDRYASNISVGDYVTPETILGYVGTTGNAAGTPPHLHFSVYAPSGAIDPLPLLVDKPV